MSVPARSGLFQYLNNGVIGMDLSREELKLRFAQRRAQRTGDLDVIQSTLFGMHGADEFCTRDPYHEGAGIFGSQKRKSITPIEVNNEAHRPDTINFFWPHLVKRITRARAAILPTIVEEVETSTEQVQPTPLVGINVRRIIVV